MFDSLVSDKCPICQKEVKAILIEECKGGYKILRCPICSLEFAHPLKGPSKEGYEAWYKGETVKIGALESYIEYHERLVSPKARRMRDYHIKALKFLKEQEFSDSPKLLDIGCAEGSFIKVMEGLGFDVYGCDIAEEPIRFAKEIYCLRNVISSAPDELPPSWRNFDIITSFEVLEHVENPLQFLASIYGMLKPSGFLLLSVPHYDIHLLKRKKGGAGWDTPPEHLTRWPPQTLRFSLTKVGFHSGCITVLQAGEWENFLDAVLPNRLENLYWRLWENKAIGRKLNLFEKAVEWGLRNSLVLFFSFLKSKYVRYSFVIARKDKET